MKNRDSNMTSYLAHEIDQKPKMEKYIIILDGPKGSGKSSISNLLRDKLPRTAFISLDGIRHLISDGKPKDEDNEIAKKGIIQLARSFLSSNISLVLDGGVGTRVEDFDSMGKEYGAKVFKYHLMAPSEILLDRVRRRDKAKGKETDEERFHYTYKMQQSRDFSGFKIIDTTQMSTEIIVESIIQDLN